MEKKKLPLWTRVFLIYLCFAAYAILCLAIGGKDIQLKRRSTSSIVETDNVGEILDGESIEQTFTTEMSVINSVTLKVGTYDRANSVPLTVELLDGDTVLGTSTISEGKVLNADNVFDFGKDIEVQPGKEYTLRITSKGASSNNAYTVYYGTPIANHVSFAVDSIDKSNVELVHVITGKRYDPLGKYFISGVIFILLLGFAYLMHMYNAEKKGKMTVGKAMINAYHQYSFLLHQLVSRQFKVRYKRSVLGVLWSVVNPMLTMLVQFFVFTLVFKSAIPNYIVYLIIGITFFSFYSEATGNGMLSIIANVQLIKKVYVPKYIYPISQVLSAAINFGISLILMFSISFITGIRPNMYMLLIPYAIICVFMLNIGVSLLLCTGMTFFNDVQFIYSVLLTALNYATPMFWDISMIPSKYLWIFKLNPMADIIIFVREVMMNNRYPGSDVAILMFIIPLFFLVVGVHVFRKNQDKFILYI